MIIACAAHLARYSQCCCSWQCYGLQGPKISSRDLSLQRVSPTKGTGEGAHSSTHEMIHDGDGGDDEDKDDAGDV